MSALVNDRRLIAMPTKGSRSRFPAWQFSNFDDERRARLARLHHSMVSEGRLSSWTAASWLIAEHPELDGLAPAEWIGRGESENTVRTVAGRDAARAAQ